MKVTVLIENTKGKNLDLVNESGLSLYIEISNKRILFDTGKSGNFIINAKKLGICLEDIDAVILSHGHHDHGGGILPFLKINNKAKIYMRKKAFDKHIFRYMIFKGNVSINKKILRYYKHRINFIDKFTEIMQEVYIITDIENKYLIPKGNKYLFTTQSDKLIKDKFDHELVMVIKEMNEISIFTGCSHNGVANMINSVRNIFTNYNIKNLIGGFHLVKIPIIKSISADSEEIETLCSKIKEENIAKIYTCHCTGEKGYKNLRKKLGSKIEYIRTGMTIDI